MAIIALFIIHLLSPLKILGMYSRETTSADHFDHSSIIKIVFFLTATARTKTIIVLAAIEKLYSLIERCTSILSRDQITQVPRQKVMEGINW